MIYLVYSEEQCTDAGEIIRFLTEEKRLTIYSHNKNCCILQSDSRINQDAAVILVSNAAVEDKEWQALVDKISGEVRIIPVSSTRNADYANPELIPSKIKEINYIRMDGKHFENIWESLVTEKEYYFIKSMILLNKNVWLFSYCSEDFLLTDRKMIKNYLLLFQNKLENESNDYFREKLSEIIDYLRNSLQYAKRLLKNKIVKYIGRISAVMAAIACLVIFLKLSSFTKRLVYTDVVISLGTYGEMAPVNAIKLVEGITNPFVSDLTKLELYNTLSEHLNESWHNTPIGVNYKWPLNDAQIAADERYIWSANGSGKVAKWDTYTGKIVEQMNISSQPLLAMAVSESENLFVVIDFDGYIYKKYYDGPWERSPINYDIPVFMETDLVCNGETGWAVVADADGKLWWFELQSGFNLIWEGQADKILCTELTDKGLEAAVMKDDLLYDLYIHADGTVEETRIPISIDSICPMDILNGVIAAADSNFQIVTWNRANPELISPAGIVLSRPVHLHFLNDDVIVYNDRNVGTHLYDLKRSLDLGEVLEDAPVVSALSASQNTVMACTWNPSVCSTENIGPLLPIDQINENDVCAVYAEKAMFSEGRIRQASIENEYMICVVLHYEEKDNTVIIDGADHYHMEEYDFPGQNNGSKPSHYVDKPVNFSGKPTVIGITDNGEALLTGSSDGSFFETVFLENGQYLRGSQLQIPSHAAITAIYQTQDFYYLEDITGTFWRARIGYDSLTSEGAIAAVKEKLHYAVSEDLCEIVSKETLKALEVEIVPGGGSREWE